MGVALVACILYVVVWVDDCVIVDDTASLSNAVLLTASLLIAPLLNASLTLIAPSLPAG